MDVPSIASAPLIPARMVNEFVYCPRLAYLEWVQGEFAHNEFTTDGKIKHRRVDQKGGRMPQADEAAETIHARSVDLSSETLGITARLDLVEGEGREWTVALSAVGLDPYRGFYHQPRFGRPALSLDMMEPFRPLIADSVVITVVNTGEIRPADFIRAAGSCALKDNARKAFIGAFERRMSQEITHPVFGYTVSYRRLLEVQARLLIRYLAGEIPRYPNFVTR